MLGFLKPKLPITQDRQEWVDSSFVRLGGILGAHRLLEAKVARPTPEHFLDTYDGSEKALHRMFRRIAIAMQVNPSEIEITVYPSDGLARNLLPFYSMNTSEAAGLYFHDPANAAHVSINESQLKEPMGLVATLAHELGHVILLRPGLVNPDEPDMEPLNDLLTVFLGFGVFTANSAFRFEQHATDTTQGWSTRRLGYLSEELFGYALARFALERGEVKPGWASFLSANIAHYFKKSAAWLDSNRVPRLFGDR